MTGQCQGSYPAIRERYQEIQKDQSVCKGVERVLGRVKVRQDVTQIKNLMEEGGLFSAHNTEWVSMLSAGRRYNFQGSPPSFLSRVIQRGGSSGSHSEDLSRGGCPWLTLICSYGCSPAAFFDGVDAVGQVEMPCAWPTGLFQSHTCLPCSKVSLLTWLIRKKVDSSPILCCRIKPSYMCMYSSFSPHLPAEHHFKHVNGSRSNPPARVYSAYSLSSYSFLLY